MARAITWVEMHSERRSLRGALWAAQIMLAATFGVIGALEITRPVAELMELMEGRARVNSH